MADRSTINWNKYGAIAGYLGIAVMLWLGLRNPGQPTPANTNPPSAFSWGWIVAGTPWLLGAFYVVGVVVGGYFHLRTAQINGYSRTTGEPRDNRVSCSDAVADFSIAQNPSGNWLYGWSNDMLGDQFESHRRKLTDALGMPRWDSPQIDALGVGCNQSENPIRGCSYTVPPHTLHMHPGKDGQYDIVRWTCPKRGTYLITGGFGGLDDQTTIADSDVNVVINSKTSLFPSIPVLSGKGTRESFTFKGIALNADDTVDFIVGVGPSGSYGADSTGLQAKIIRQ